MMRTASGIFVAIFLLSAAVQWNDPDPLLWIAGYLVAAALSAAACFGRIPVLPNACASLAFALWFLSLASSLPGAPSEAFTSFEMVAPAHEQPREAIGLLICTAWTGFLAWRGTRAGSPA
jgi:Transmembrane family 220, helix